MNKTGGHLRATAEETIALIRRLAEHYDDRTIAAILAKQKRRTATGLTWTRPWVATLRAHYNIPPTSQTPPRSLHIPTELCRGYREAWSPVLRCGLRRPRLRRDRRAASDATTARHRLIEHRR